MIHNLIKKTILIHLFIAFLFLHTTASTGTEGGAPGENTVDDLHTSRQISDPKVSWEQFGPGSAGYCDATWYHPADPDYIYIAPDMYNIYMSSDGADSWRSVRDFDGSSCRETRYNRRLRNMAFSPHDENLAVAVSHLGLWITEDKGRTWRADPRNGTDFWHPDHWADYLSAAAFDPGDKNTLYAGSGNFWNVKGNISTYDNPHGQAWIHSAGPSNPGKIWRSDDAGASWKLKNEGLHPKAETGQIFVDPEDSQIVYAATPYGFYKSTNRGKNWEKRNAGLDTGIIKDMDMHKDPESGELRLYVIDLVTWEPTEDGRVEIGGGGVFISLDRGENWELKSENLKIYPRELGSSEINNAFYNRKSLPGWLGISESEARSEYSIPESIKPIFNRIAVDPGNPDRIYVSHNPRHTVSFPLDGVWMTEDGGENWWIATRINRGWEKDADFWQEQYHPQDVDLTKQNMNFGHIRHTRFGPDNLYPWDGRDYPLFHGIRSLAVNSEGHVLIGMNQQLLLSRDHGRSWNQVDQIEVDGATSAWIGRGNSNLPGRFIHQDPRLPETPYFTSGEHGLWKVSTRGRERFPEKVAVQHLQEQTPSPSFIAFHPDDASTLYMLAFRQMHAGSFRKSTDGGKTWETLSQPVERVRNRVHQYSLMIDRDNPDNIYFCIPSGSVNDVGRPDSDVPTGVYKSKDGGLSWQIKNAGLPEHASVHRIIFDNHCTETIYAAVLKEGNATGGLYRTLDGAKNWDSVNTPESIEQVNSVHMAENGNLFIACGTESGALESGGVWVSSDEGSSWDKIFDMPFIFTVTTAPYDSERILTAAGPAAATDRKNPGIYLSEDGGGSWVKTNTNLGQFDAVFDAAFDIEDPDIFWASCWGSGFYKGTYNNDLKSVYEQSIAPGDFQLKKPVIGRDTDGSLRAELKWEPAEHPANPYTKYRYRVKVAADPDFDSVLFDTITEKTAIEVQGLESASRYFWRVAAIPGLPWHSGRESPYAEFACEKWFYGESFSSD